MVVEKNETSIRCFLGMCGFYRRWISQYARMAKPLSDLLCKDVNISKQWDERADKAVQNMKNALTTYPVLRQPDFKKPWIVCSDASDYACGGCVSQEHDGKLCPVAYCSRAFKGPELKYTVQEKECLGVIYCLKKFTQYITYCPAFQIRLMTDHYSLQFLHNQKLIATGRMARWAMELAEHNAKIYYVKGRTNYTGDCLSRLLDLSETEFDTTQNLMVLYPRFQLMIQKLLTHRPSVEGISSEIDEEKYLSFWIKKASEFDKKLDNFDISCKTNSTRSDGNAPHECVLFSTARVSINTKPLSITHEMYLKCHDFGLIYQCLNEKYKDTVSKENFKRAKRVFS